MTTEREAIPLYELDMETEREFEEMLSDMQEEEDDDSFKIDNDGLADWAVRKIQAEREENKRLHDIADEQIAHIQEKISQADRRLQSRTSYLTGKLSQYFETVPHRTTKTQEKYQLLSGALVMTKPKEVLEQDDDALVDYLVQSGQMEFITMKPAWGKFKKQLAFDDGRVLDTVTGELIDCVKVVVKDPSFDVR